MVRSPFCVQLVGGYLKSMDGVQESQASPGQAFVSYVRTRWNIFYQWRRALDGRGLVWNERFVIVLRPISLAGLPQVPVPIRERMLK